MTVDDLAAFRSFSREVSTCDDLIDLTTQIYNEAQTSPSSSTISQHANTIRTADSVSCYQAEKDFAIEILLNSLEKLREAQKIIQKQILDLGGTLTNSTATPGLYILSIVINCNILI